MKIECINNKVIVYLYKYKLSFDNIEKLNEEIKGIFIKLIKHYQMNFFGYFKVDIYENENYGSILEIDKVYQSDFNIEIIDLKLIIHRNVPFYFEFDDYYFFMPKEVFLKNNKYYIKMDNVNNIFNYVEYGKIVYNKKEVFKLLKI